jgi:hypothetical protein
MNAMERRLARSWLGIERMPDGLPGVRDVDAPCADFTPGTSPGTLRIGDCDTDGHYLCEECVHVVVREDQREVKP